MSLSKWRGRKLFWMAAVCAAAASVLFAACGSSSPSDSELTQTAAAKSPTSSATKASTTSVNTSSIPSNVGKDDNAQLTGAGATFPGPLYTRWFSDYKSSVAPGVEVNYQAIGSGGGIQQITAKTVDVGASDAPMSDAEMGKAPGIQANPTKLGAVVIR